MKRPRLILDQKDQSLCSLYALVGLLYNRGAISDEQMKGCLAYEGKSVGLPASIKIISSLADIRLFYIAEKSKIRIHNITKSKGMIVRIGGGIWQSAVSPPNFLTIGQAGTTGHFVYAIDLKDDILTCVNSWGEDWGDGGLFYINLANVKMNRLSFWSVEKIK